MPQVESAREHAEKGWQQQSASEPGELPGIYPWDGTMFDELNPFGTFKAAEDQQDRSHYNPGRDEDLWAQESSCPGSDFEPEEISEDPAASMSASSTSTQSRDISPASNISACVSQQQEPRSCGLAKNNQESCTASAPASNSSLWVNRTDFYRKSACDGCGKSMAGLIMSRRTVGREPTSSKPQLAVWCHSSRPCWLKGMKKVGADPFIQKEISRLASNEASTYRIATHVLCPCADCGTSIHYRMHSVDQARHSSKVRQPTAERGMHCSTACVPSRRR